MEKQQSQKTSDGLYSAGVASIVGGRASQQDSYQLIFSSDNLHLNPANPVSNINSCTEIIIALTDGVGGEVAGDVAANLVAVNFTEYVSSHKLKSPDIKELMTNAMYEANQSIKQMVKKNKAYKRMATTLVGAIVDKEGLKWISVGDSHLYLVREGKISKLNADHSMGALIDYDYLQGKLTKEEAMNAPYRNVILSCIGGGKVELVDVYEECWALQSGDKVILASDGLDSLTRDEVLLVAEEAGAAEETAESLVAAVLAKKRPYQDNTTVVVIDRI